MLLMGSSRLAVGPSVQEIPHRVGTHAPGTLCPCLKCYGCWRTSLIAASTLVEVGNQRWFDFGRIAHRTRPTPVSVSGSGTSYGGRNRPTPAVAAGRLPGLPGEQAKPSGAGSRPRTCRKPGGAHRQVCPQWTSRGLRAAHDAFSPALRGRRPGAFRRSPPARARSRPRGRRPPVREGGTRCRPRPLPLGTRRVRPGS